MQTRTPAEPRLLRAWRPVLAVACAASAYACTAKATPPDDEEPGGSVVRLPPDGGPRPDARIDTTPDAAPPCALPLTFDLGEDDFGYFLYDHPDCSGGEGLGDGATIVFEDRTDEEPYFQAYAPETNWHAEELAYDGLQCFVESDTLVCDSQEAGKLIPIRLTDGSTLIDVEFRIDLDQGSVTIESADYTE